MLLRHTPKKSRGAAALSINPAKTCQPIGAMYAALGIHGCLPHSHGSQGCCAYHRSTLTRHYKEPVSAATSSFTEGSLGLRRPGQPAQAIDNIFTVYEPDVIAVHTTCLSETIGDDLQADHRQGRQGRQGAGGQARDQRQRRPAMSART
jgi:nitrogenase molybdenum-iron protein beta chain